jgi:hypothetical protein
LYVLLNSKNGVEKIFTEPFTPLQMVKVLVFRIVWIRNVSGFQILWIRIQGEKENNIICHEVRMTINFDWKKCKYYLLVSGSGLRFVSRPKLSYSKLITQYLAGGGGRRFAARRHAARLAGSE